MSDTPRAIALTCLATMTPNRTANLTVPGFGDCDFCFYDLKNGRVAWACSTGGALRDAGGIAKSKDTEQGAAKMGARDQWKMV